MSNTNKNIPQKAPRVVIAFRHSNRIKTELGRISASQNLDPASIYRNVFNAGLKKLYGFQIVNNELVEEATKDSKTSSVSR